MSAHEADESDETPMLLLQSSTRNKAEESALPQLDTKAIYSTSDLDRNHSRTEQKEEDNELLQQQEDCRRLYGINSSFLTQI